MAQITIDVDEQELARAQARAQEAGLSVADWLRQMIQRADNAALMRPQDSLFGWLADDPEAADAIDDVVAERAQRYQPRFEDL